MKWFSLGLLLVLCAWLVHFLSGGAGSSRLSGPDFPVSSEPSLDDVSRDLETAADGNDARAVENSPTVAIKLGVGSGGICDSVDLVLYDSRLQSLGSFRSEGLPDTVLCPLALWRKSAGLRATGDGLARQWLEYSKPNSEGQVSYALAMACEAEILLEDGSLSESSPLVDVLAFPIEFEVSQDVIASDSHLMLPGVQVHRALSVGEGMWRFVDLDPAVRYSVIAGGGDRLPTKRTTIACGDVVSVQLGALYSAVIRFCGEGGSPIRTEAFSNGRLSWRPPAGVSFFSVNENSPQLGFLGERGVRRPGSMPEVGSRVLRLDYVVQGVSANRVGPFEIKFSPLGYKPVNVPVHCFRVNAEGAQVEEVIVEMEEVADGWGTLSIDAALPDYLALFGEELSLPLRKGFGTVYLRQKGTGEVVSFPYEPVDGHAISVELPEGEYGISFLAASGYWRSEQVSVGVTASPDLESQCTLPLMGMPTALVYIEPSTPTLMQRETRSKLSCFHGAGQAYLEWSGTQPYVLPGLPKGYSTLRILTEGVCTPGKEEQTFLSPGEGDDVPVAMDPVVVSFSGVEF